MKVAVEIYSNIAHLESDTDPLHVYAMNHNDAAERRVLGEQCRNAFEAGQVVVTYRME